MALTHILVVKELKRSREFYQDILGAEVYREYNGTSCVLKFLENWLLIVTGGEPTKDKPNVIFEVPRDMNSINHAMTIRVKNCQDAYAVLKSRGAEFITPPVDWGNEVRCFFRDPDGHLFELSEVK
jgi:catechol 2,3-dioxygenase-like lactoylglutathione lyase family enzyme